MSFVRILCQARIHEFLCLFLKLRPKPWRWLSYNLMHQFNDTHRIQRLRLVDVCLQTAFTLPPALPFFLICLEGEGIPVGQRFVLFSESGGVVAEVRQIVII